MSTKKSNKPKTEKSIHAGHRERLRERYARSGMDDFADHEVMELLLTYAIPRVDVNPQAHDLINRFGSVAGVLDALPQEICEINGVGPAAAQFLTMLPSVFRRYALNKSEPGEPMETLSKIGEYLHAKYTGINFERVYLLLFDNSMRLIDCCHLCDGSVNCAKISTRQVVELSLLKHASCAVLAHNHPMGLAIPSSADLEVTQSVESALNTVEVMFLDHIIVTENSYASVMRRHRGVLRASPCTGEIDKRFFERYYGDGK